MKASKTWTGVLSLATGFGILLQWILIWSGAFPVAESVPGFRNYFLSFAGADLWLVLASFLTGAFIFRKDPKALLFGVALGSAMVFFGLYALLYDFNTGLLFDFSAGEWFGKAVTFYNLIAGVLFMVLSWRDRDAAGSHPLPTGSSS